MDNQNLNNMNQNNDTNLNNYDMGLPNGEFNSPINQNVQNNNEQILSDNIEVLDDDLINNSTALNNQNNSFIIPPQAPTADSNELLNAVPKPDMMISTPTTNMITSEDLLEEFIGKNYEKISKRKFNLSAFFFSGFYFMYRKMYFYGIAISIVLLFANLGLALINPFVSLILSLIISIILCLTFNKIYLNFAKNKIDKIKNNNKSKSISDLNKICNKKGGTSFIVAFVISIFLSGILTSVINVIMPDIGEDILNKFTEDNVMIIDDDSNDDNETNYNDDTSYNGEINYKEDILINDKINIGYLQVFQPGVLNSEFLLNYNYQTNQNVESSNCSFTFGVVKDYTSSERLISEIAKYHNISNNISTTNADNGLIWNSLTYNENLISVYYDALENEGEVYLLSYEIQPSAEQAICDAFYKGILNSIEVK